MSAATPSAPAANCGVASALALERCERVLVPRQL
jgi:hypothetical protein